ncbi:MAG: hypothetical protein HC830_10400 [Bacteroidetes bacterium]|nr:hypothetical protein [Bacteroidota bacterium]
MSIWDIKIRYRKIIRDPVAITEDNEIICVGEIQKGTFIDIMHGSNESLVEAAREAFNISKSEFGDRPRNFTLFIDCISRVLFLEDNFYKELEAVYEPDIPLLGALTIGEIANNGKDFIEFYNKTSVVGSF